jgi:D-galactarolactone cycloisomerase
MLITGIESFTFRRVLDGRHWNSTSRWHERQAPLLRITTRDGLRGLGEGWCEQEGDVAAFSDRLKQAGPHLLGRDAREIEEIFADLRALPGEPCRAAAAVAAAVDMALWDLRAQREETPLFRLLGGASHVPVHASGGLYADGKTQEDLAGEMLAYRARGFTTVKMKIGALPMQDDLARVAAVRAALGKRADIIVDAVGRLPRDGADWAAELRTLGVRLVQSPLPEEDLDGMAALSRGGAIRVIAGKTAFQPDAFQALAQVVDWLQFNPGLTGITGALALPARTKLSPQCHGTAVLQAVSLHLGAASGAVSCGYHMFHDHLHDALPAPMRQVVDGQVVLDDRPGLGLQPDLLETAQGLARVWSVAA